MMKGKTEIYLSHVSGEVSNITLRGKNIFGDKRLASGERGGKIRQRGRRRGPGRAYIGLAVRAIISLIACWRLKWRSRWISLSPTCSEAAQIC